jgi:hypothetical protein
MIMRCSFHCLLILKCSAMDTCYTFTKYHIVHFYGGSNSNMTYTRSPIMLFMLFLSLFIGFRICLSYWQYFYFSTFFLIFVCAAALHLPTRCRCLFNYLRASLWSWHAWTRWPVQDPCPWRSAARGDEVGRSAVFHYDDAAFEHWGVCLRDQARSKL